MFAGKPTSVESFLNEGELEKVCTSFGEHSEFSNLCTSLSNASMRAHCLKCRIKLCQELLTEDLATLQHAQVGLAAARGDLGEILPSIPTSVAIESPEAAARCYCFFSHIEFDLIKMPLSVDGMDMIVAL